jgi:hypothetical protein
VYDERCVQVLRFLRKDHKDLLDRLADWVWDEYDFNSRFAAWLVFYASEAYIARVKEEHADKGNVVLDPKRNQPQLSLVDGARKLKIDISEAHQKSVARRVESDLGDSGTTPNDYGRRDIDDLAEKAATHLVVTAAGVEEHIGDKDSAERTLESPEDIVTAFLEGSDYGRFRHDQLDFYIFTSIDRNLQFKAQERFETSSEWELEHFLGIRQGGKPYIKDGYLTTCNSSEFRSIQRAVTLNTFEVDPKRNLPSAPISRGGNLGEVVISPPEGRDLVWDAHRRLDAKDADTMDMLTAVFLKEAQDAQDLVLVKIDDLLRMRGLKEKSRGGIGRRHGFKKEQRQEMVESVRRVEDLRIEMAKIAVYDETTKKIESLEGRAFEVTYHRGANDNVMAIVFRPGVVFAVFLFGTGRQVAPISEKVLQYDPTKKVWEKQLARYFAWQWRIRATKPHQPLTLPLKISSLLDQVGVPGKDMRRPGRVRTRLETALTTLAEDGVIQQYTYVTRPPAAGFRDSSSSFLNCLVEVEAPAYIRDHYKQAASPTKVPLGR